MVILNHVCTPGPANALPSRAGRVRSYSPLIAEGNAFQARRLPLIRIVPTLSTAYRASLMTSAWPSGPRMRNGPVQRLPYQPSPCSLAKGLREHDLSAVTLCPRTFIGPAGYAAPTGQLCTAARPVISNASAGPGIPLRSSAARDVPTTRSATW